MSDLFGNHIVGFPTRRLIYLPTSLHQYFQVQFEDILAEPEGVRSFGCVWRLSAFCFNFCFGCTYKCATLWYGICIAAEWGYEFAIIAFYHVWFITPLVRVLDINCMLCRKIYKNCTVCCIEPCCEACGALFYNFKKN